MFRLRHVERQETIAEHVKPAKTLRDRLVGLLGHSNLSSGCGLWIDPCRSIHTFFMRFSIDVIFLSEDLRAVCLYHSLPPFRLTRVVWKARSVIELPSGTLDQASVRVGDRLALEAAH